MRGTIILKTGDEFDALTRWRKFCIWRAGDRAAIKRGYRRRVRREARRVCAAVRRAPDKETAAPLWGKHGGAAGLGGC